MSFDLPRDVILPVDAVDVVLDDAPHPFEVANAESIDRNWRHESAANPALFDGTMVLLSRLDYRDRRLEGRCHAIRFATFLYWRSRTQEATADHAFAHAVLVTKDNMLLAVRMGNHTVNSGRVYFAAGSFEPQDFSGGKVDIDYNMRREVLEETGIDLAEARPEPALQALSGAGGTVIFRRYFLEETAAALVARVTAHVAASEEPEIDGPVVIRGANDMPDGLMVHMRAIVEWHFRLA